MREQLIAHAKAGDQAAIERLYYAAFKMLNAAFFYRIRNVDDREDFIQDILAEFFTKTLQIYDPARSILPYFLKEMARRSWIDWLKAGRVRRRGKKNIRDRAQFLFIYNFSPLTEAEQATEELLTVLNHLPTDLPSLKGFKMQVQAEMHFTEGVAVSRNRNGVIYLVGVNRVTARSRRQRSRKILAKRGIDSRTIWEMPEHRWVIFRSEGNGR
ncbi:MAG: RNA polymerase sigma factor [Dongiaceae bacterium]